MDLEAREKSEKIKINASDYPDKLGETPIPSRKLPRAGTTHLSAFDAFCIFKDLPLAQRLRLQRTYKGELKF